MPHLGNDSILPELARINIDCRAIVGVGKIDASSDRLWLQDEAVALGFFVPVVVSPRALVNEEIEPGAGTAVLNGWQLRGQRIG